MLSSSSICPMNPPPISLLQIFYIANLQHNRTNNVNDVNLGVVYYFLDFLYGFKGWVFFCRWAELQEIAEKKKETLDLAHDVNNWHVESQETMVNIFESIK